MQRNLPLTNSIEAWTKKYLPVLDTVNASDPTLAVIDHSITKWLGLKKKILTECELFVCETINRRMVLKSRHTLDYVNLDAETCSLCIHAKIIAADKSQCQYCPLTMYLKTTCYNEWFYFAKHRKPKPMIRLLKQLRRVYLMSQIPYTKGTICRPD